MSGKTIQALVKAKQAYAVLNLIFAANPNATEPEERNTIEYAAWAARDLIKDGIDILEREEGSQC